MGAGRYGNISGDGSFKVLYFGNQAIKCGTGFAAQIGADFAISAITFQQNLSTGNDVGFSVVPGFQSEDGSSGSGAGNVSLTDNVAEHGGVGFDTSQPGAMLGNTAAGNARAGFIVVPNNGAFRNNSAIGNSGPGLVVNFSADHTEDGSFNQRHLSAFAQNNVIGNDRNRPAQVLSFLDEPANVGPSAHCGILNIGAALNQVHHLPPVPQKLIATGSFWGSSNGPSPTGPADAAGGACDQNGGQTLVKPFATADFAITSLP